MLYNRNPFANLTRTRGQAPVVTKLQRTLINTRIYTREELANIVQEVVANAVKGAIDQLSNVIADNDKLRSQVEVLERDLADSNVTLSGLAAEKEELMSRVDTLEMANADLLAQLETAARGSDQGGEG